jgi:hypothetical protein
MRYSAWERADQAQHTIVMLIPCTHVVQGFVFPGMAENGAGAEWGQ